MISERTIGRSSPLPKRVLFALILLGTFFILCAGSHAGEAELSFDIPTQEIVPALKQFANQTGLSLVYKLDEAGTMQSPGVSGTHSPGQALRILLAGTGLGFLKTGERSLAIVEAGEGALVTEQAQPAEAGRPAESDHVIAQATEPRQAVAQADAGKTDEPEKAKVAGEEEKAEEEKDLEVFVLEELIVTAEKRKESVLEVPLTMTHFSARKIEEQGMSDFKDLEQLVPGLQFGSTFLLQGSLGREGGGQMVTIRGIGTPYARDFDGYGFRDLAVGIYVDGVYTADTYGLAPSLFDMERVEIARGPQGTLHGSHSIAGAISFHNKKPADTWDATILAEFTDQVTQRYNVAFGGPLPGPFADSVSFRITGGLHFGDGAQENFGTGPDRDAPDQTSIAPQLRFRSGRFDVNLRYQYTVDRGLPPSEIDLAEYVRDDPEDSPGRQQWYLYDKPVPSVANCDNPVVRVSDWDEELDKVRPQWLPVYAPPLCDGIRNVILSNRGGIQDNRTDRYTLNADFEASKWLTLRYTFGMAETSTLGSADPDNDRTGHPDHPNIPSDVDPADWPIQYFQDRETLFVHENDESSHELQLISDFDGPLNFIVGVYHYENEIVSSSHTADYSHWARFVDVEGKAAELGAILEEYRAAGTSFYDLPGIPWWFAWVGITYPDAPLTSCRDWIEWSLPEMETGWRACPAGEDHRVVGASIRGGASETYAAFANAEYQLNDRWRFALGIRYTEDNRRRAPIVPEFAAKFVDITSADEPLTRGNVPGGYSCSTMPLTASLDPKGEGFVFCSVGTTQWDAPSLWNSTAGHVSIEYTPEDFALIYGRISNGYRSGGYTKAEGWVRRFDPEILINYEVGAKGLFLDNRLMLTTGLFYQDYYNKQLHGEQIRPEERTTRDPETGLAMHTSPYTSYTANVDDVAIWGIETEFTFQIDERWRVSGYYNYLDSVVGGEHISSIHGDPQAEMMEWKWFAPWPTWEPPAWTERPPGPRTSYRAALVDLRGKRLPQMPKHKFAVTVAYTIDLANFSKPSLPLGTLQFLSTYSWTDKRYPNMGEVERTRVPAYGRWDFRATWDSYGRKWGLTLFVQNVLDEIGVVEWDPSMFFGTLTDPRRIGLQIRWDR